MHPKQWDIPDKIDQWDRVLFPSNDKKWREGSIKPRVPCRLQQPV